MKILSTTPDLEVPKNEPKQTVEVVKTSSYTEPLPKKDTQDKPFSATYFEVPEWGGLLLAPKLDANGIVSKISFIESYLSSQLGKNSMKNDIESFREILADIESSLGIDSRHDVAHRVSRVFGFLNVIKSTKDREELRRERLLSMLKK